MGNAYTGKHYASTHTHKDRVQFTLDDVMDEEDRMDMEQKIELVLCPEFGQSDALVGMLGGELSFGDKLARRLNLNSGSDNSSTTAITITKPTENNKKQGLGFESQSFSKRKRKLAIAEEDEDDEDDDEEKIALPKLMPRKRAGLSSSATSSTSGIKFVKKENNDFKSTSNGKCKDGVGVLPGFVLMNTWLLPRVKVEEEVNVPNEWERETIKVEPTERKKRRFGEKVVTNSNKPIMLSETMASMFTMGSETTTTTDEQEPESTSNNSGTRISINRITNYDFQPIVCKRFGVVYKPTATAESHRAAKNDAETMVNIDKNQALEQEKAPDELFNLVFGNNSDKSIDKL